MIFFPAENKLNMKKILSIVACLAVVFPWVWGCDTPTSQVDEQSLDKSEIIVATIDGRKTTLEEFEGYLRQVKKLKGLDDSPQAQNIKREYLLRYIERILFLREARKKAITVSEEEISADIEKIAVEYPKDSPPQLDWKDETAWRKEIRAQLMVKKLIRQEVHDKIKISSSDLKKYYDADNRDFHRKEMVRVRQIMVDTEKEANELRKKILSGKSFIKLAQKHSQSPDREKGGDLGFFARSQMPMEFDEAAFSLKRKNQISPVFRSAYGYHIFQLIDKRRAKKLKFSEVKDKINKILRAQREKEEFNRWFSNLKKQSKIKINEAFL
jgi:parvulin-like peptidyl-prolyl isomerase